MFDEDALDGINEKETRATAILARLKELPLDDVATFVGARRIVLGSKPANAIEEGDVFLLPLATTTNAAGAPTCVSTVESLALSDPFAICVADLSGGQVDKLILVATAPSTAIMDKAVNFIGPKGSALYLQIDPDELKLLEAGVSISRKAQEELARMKGKLK